MLTRRAFLGAGGVVLAGLPRLSAPRAGEIVEIAMQSDPLGTHVRFSPLGLFVAPGTTLRWTNGANVHTTTAYHPDNDDHALRIPESAPPWDSGYLVEPGESFEVTLAVPGVYDYFCAPHELAGMVGRIVVGEAGGPGSLPFDYFDGQADKVHWQPVPEAARQAFPSIEDILTAGRIA